MRIHTYASFLPKPPTTMMDDPKLIAACHLRPYLRDPAILQFPTPFSSSSNAAIVVWGEPPPL